MKPQFRRMIQREDICGGELPPEKEEDHD